MTSTFSEPNALASGELRSLTDAELEEVNGGFLGVLILVGCAAVAVYCTYKMAKQ